VTRGVRRTWAVGEGSSIPTRARIYYSSALCTRAYTEFIAPLLTRTVVIRKKEACHAGEGAHTLLVFLLIRLCLALRRPLKVYAWRPHGTASNQVPHCAHYGRTHASLVIPILSIPLYRALSAWANLFFLFF
jgi:hypothetical protein